jgi:hypothetical protein
MQSVWKSKGEKIHSRSIEVSTYEYAEQRIVVEGYLKDDRFQDTRLLTGEPFPRGAIHQMRLRLLINCSTFVIEDLDVGLLAVPREFCRETEACLAPIKGLTITRGFTEKVKKLAGGRNGCTHLLELLQAITPAVFQGVATYQSREPSGVDAHQAKLVVKYLTNTCHAWREDGPFVEIFKQMDNMNPLKGEK